MNLHLPNMHIAGVDGCRGGWLCVEQIDDMVRSRIYRTFNDLIDDLSADSVIAIDVPIGLPDADERPCDKIARKILGPPRASSVFPAPVRGVLSESDYQLACKKHRQIDGRALTKQAFAILGKINDVDAVLSAEPFLQQRVREVHPEVCFATWNNEIPMQYNKAKSLGRFEREQLIDTEWPGHRSKLIADMTGCDFRRDDLNDAFAALWTAKRISLGTARVLGSQSIDRHGLRMEMWT